MYASTKVSTLLKRKNPDIYTARPDTVVLEAIGVMAEKDIGALPVLEGEKLVGVISERDYSRKVILKGRASKEALVRDIMNADVPTVSPQDTVGVCMEFMTDKRIRHLPVIEGSKLVGIISIGDVVNWMIAAQKAAIAQLEKFVSGEYPA